MTARLEAAIAAQDVEIARLRGQLQALAGGVDVLRSDSAEADAKLARHAQHLEHLVEDVADALEEANGATMLLHLWAPTLARLLPLFKALHWPDPPGVAVTGSGNREPAPSVTADAQGAARERQPG